VTDKRKHWLDEPRNVTLLIRLLLAVCVVLVLADFVYDKHGDYGWEEWFGFHAWFGFASFFLLVLTGKPLRKLLGRDEDYYDR